MSGKRQQHGFYELPDTSSGASLPRFFAECIGLFLLVVFLLSFVLTGCASPSGTPTLTSVTGPVERQSVRPFSDVVTTSDPCTIYTDGVELCDGITVSPTQVDVSITVYLPPDSGSYSLHLQRSNELQNWTDITQYQRNVSSHFYSQVPYTDAVVIAPGTEKAFYRVAAAPQ